MKQTNLFSKTRFDAPKDEVSKNASLLIRAGFIHKDMAGVYSLLPLGLRVVKKIENIIREEMNAISGEEVHLASLQNKELWEKTDRWNDEIVDNWFKTSFKSGGETGLAFTHEEPITNLLKNHISSYRDLPRFVYQFQTKFRNETRAKSGILRGREFLMKDLYSFSADEKSHEVFYGKVKESYINIFRRCGIGEKTYFTFASGGSFSKFSHEFQTETDAGEDVVYLDTEKNIAINKEVLNDEVLSFLGISKEKLVEKKTVEVGNIFTLGTKFSDALSLNYKDEEGKTKSVFMGSYGIGVGRLMGTIVEINSIEDKMCWPKEVSPFDIHLVTLSNDENINSFAESLYSDLEKKGVSILFDNRDLRAGEKLHDADLIGIPKRIVVGPKNFSEGKVEYIDLEKKENSLVDLKDVVNVI